MFEVRPDVPWRTQDCNSYCWHIGGQHEELGLTLLGTICILLARTAYSQEKTAAKAVEVLCILKTPRVPRIKHLEKIVVGGSDPSKSFDERRPSQA